MAILYKASISSHDGASPWHLRWPCHVKNPFQRLGVTGKTLLPTCQSSRVTMPNKLTVHNHTLRQYSNQAKHGCNTHRHMLTQDTSVTLNGHSIGSKLLYKTYDGCPKGSALLYKTYVGHPKDPRLVTHHKHRQICNESKQSCNQCSQLYIQSNIYNHILSHLSSKQ